MAGFAVDGGVGSDKREAVEMGFRIGLGSELPTPHGVAILTLTAHLAPVEIGVAVGAGLADIRKNLVDVATGAVHIVVHAAQRISRVPVVIELDVGAQWFPGRRGVTGFARLFQRSVRIARLAARGFRRLPREASCE